MGSLARKRFYRGQRYELKATDIEAFRSFLGKFEKRNRKITDIALHRLRYVQDRESPEDKLIDCVIGFESLLLNAEAELTLRLALRAAMVLGENKGDREKIFDEMREIYRVRNKIVHGSGGGRENINEIAKNAEKYLRLAIPKFLALSSIKKRNKLLEKLDNSVSPQKRDLPICQHTGELPSNPALPNNALSHGALEIRPNRHL